MDARKGPRTPMQKLKAKQSRVKNLSKRGLSKPLPRKKRK